ncbi:TAXI family TRAP transporter solute-binding subunit [Salirhabdus salicampi]|uniref:TAXI family TRAP transporter solute-binding subunit n=1 Tax=Salirhabdus salicampi TaxID=476102 RepID=UPI0020C20255|nr:TAXI family TRAP transporter solute-binding subunit [Salirhabdus salicampi]MCP8615828.1 TAXI family TRAP transporter solute-binding subunit [Salirhabdus salicampi]
MKNLLFFVGTLMLIFVVGCNSESSSGTEDGPVTITTGSEGGSWYPIGGALADMMNEDLERTNISAVPGGGTANPAAVSIGEADIGFSYGPTLFSALQGTDPYEEEYGNLKAIARLYNLAWQVIVDADSDITSLQDIVDNQIGVKWVPNKRGTGDEWIAQKVIQEYGFTYEDVQDWGGEVNFVTMSEAVSLWRDRHINMYSTHTLIPAPTVTESTLARDAVFLSIDDDIIQTLREKYELVETTLPAGTYEGQDEDIKTVTMPVVLFAREDVSDEVVYSLTKILNEKHEKLIDVHTLFNEFDPKTAWKDTGIELHPGAEQYYKEVGYMD